MRGLLFAAMVLLFTLVACSAHKPTPTLSPTQPSALGPGISGGGAVSSTIPFDFPTPTPTPTPLPTLLLSNVRAFVVQDTDATWTTVIGSLTNTQSVLVYRATVSVEFLGAGSVLPMDVREQQYTWLNPGDVRFFKLRTPRMYSTDFRVTVDWVAWPAGKEPNTSYAIADDAKSAPRVLAVKDVWLDRCRGTSTAAKLCYFRVVVRSLFPDSGARGNVDIGLFDSTGGLIDVILTQDGMAGIGRFTPSGTYDTNIGADAGVSREWELQLMTNQPVESMVDWKGGPW